MSRWHFLVATLGSAPLLLCACGSALEVELPSASAKVGSPGGLSWPMRTAVDAFLDFNAFIGSQSGYVAMFARDGRVVHATTSGYADIESGRPMQLDTRFRIASMTKPITAVAALLLIEEGRLGLYDPVERYIPAAGRVLVASSHGFSEEGTIPTVPLSRPLTIRHLLTFRSGIGNRRDPSDLGRLWAERDLYAGTGSLAERVDRVLSAPLYEQPGEMWRYGGSADILARVIEVAADEPFDQFLEGRIFAPLGMGSTSYVLAAEERETVATMYTQDRDQNLIRVDPPVGEPVGWAPGGSGLISTAGDYMRFALMLWNGGTYDGVQILSRDSVSLMTQAHVTTGVLEKEGFTGLGWGLGIAVVVDAEGTPSIDRNGDYWWAGYYGTTFFVSPAAGLVGVVLSQNKPSPFSSKPFALHLAGPIAFFGL